MTSKEIIPEIALELLKKKYLKQEDVIKRIEKTKNLEKIENILFDRFNAIGLELVKIKYDHDMYYVVIISRQAPDIDAVTMGVFLVLAGFLELNQGRRNSKIIEEMFYEHRSKLTRLQEEEYIKIDNNDDYRITPLGKAILFDVWDNLPKILQEKLDTLKI